MADDPPASRQEPPDPDPAPGFAAPMTPEPGPPAPVAPPRPWGPWATAGWTAFVVAAMQAVQAAVLIGFAVVQLARDPKADLPALLPALGADGTFLGVATLASTPAVVALVALLAHLRLPIGDYLALRGTSARRAALAAAGMVAFLAASDGLTHALGRPLVPPSMAEIYRSASLPPLLVALLICAPLGEELLIRGFLYRGLADSRLGPGIAIGLTALAWALMHVQYDLYGIATVYLMGLYLGVVRHLTGSLPMTILLHVLANAVATAEAAATVGRGG